jgi:hypothetical protein
MKQQRIETRLWAVEWARRVGSSQPVYLEKWDVCAQWSAVVLLFYNTRIATTNNIQRACIGGENAPCRLVSINM